MPQYRPKSARYADGGWTGKDLNRVNILPPSQDGLRTQYPALYGALVGLMGTAPDQMDGSVLEPGYADRKAGAEKTFTLGSLLQMLPLAQGVAGRAATLSSSPAAGSRAAQRGAVTWHGSPYKFDKFDSSKIGTGEGAQAYGYGLYLAEAPDVARTYSADRGYVGAAMAGKPQAINYDDPAWIAQKTIDELGDPAKAKAHLEMVQRTAAKYQPAETRAAVQEAIDMIASGSVAPKGNLYKVDLPDEHIAKMLDWDKPLSQQAPEVQAVLMKHPDVLEQIQKSEAQRLQLNQQSPLRLEKIPSASIPYDASRMAGKDALTAIQQRSALGKTGGVEEQLRQAGIPGIRYLDGGSRGTGAGTSNYVVFPGNERLLKILERNGVPIATPVQQEALKVANKVEQQIPDYLPSTTSKGVDGALFKGYQGETYYEPPDVRMEKLKRLYGAFGSKDPTTYDGGMSPAMARGLYEKGLLKATPKETKLLLDMTDSQGNIRPQIEGPASDINTSNAEYLRQLSRDPKKWRYASGVREPSEYAKGGRVTVCNTGGKSTAIHINQPFVRIKGFDDKGA